MYRLGIAELNGELGLTTSPKEGVKWLKRGAESATAEFPHALHELALLHERGINNVLFVDYEYAAELGYAPSAYRLGECYGYGKMGCPQDPALPIHFHPNKTTATSPSPSPPGTSSPSRAYFLSPTQRRFCGEEGSRCGAREGYVCGWVFFGGWHWDGGRFGFSPPILQKRRRMGR